MTPLGGSIPKITKEHTQINELLRCQQWHFNDFSQLLKLFFTTSNIIIGDIWFFLDSHHGDSGINFRRQWHLNHILLSVHSDSHTLFHVSSGYFFTEFDHKLGDLLDMDDIFVVLAVCDDFIAPGHLQRLLRSHLGISMQVPLGWERKSGVELLDSWINADVYLSIC